MATICLSLWEFLTVVGFAVALAATDASAVSRLAVTYTAKKAGLEPSEIYAYSAAADDTDPDDQEAEDAN